MQTHGAYGHCGAAVVKGSDTKQGFMTPCTSLSNVSSYSDCTPLRVPIFCMGDRALTFIDRSSQALAPDMSAGQMCDYTVNGTSQSYVDNPRRCIIRMGIAVRRATLKLS